MRITTTGHHCGYSCGLSAPPQSGLLQFVVPVPQPEFHEMDLIHYVMSCDDSARTADNEFMPPITTDADARTSEGASSASHSPSPLRSIASKLSQRPAPSRYRPERGHPLQK